MEEGNTPPQGGGQEEVPPLSACQACGVHVGPGVQFCGERCKRAYGWLRKAEAERTPFMTDNVKSDAKHVESMLGTGVADHSKDGDDEKKRLEQQRQQTQVHHLFQQQLQQLQQQHAQQRQQLAQQLLQQQKREREEFDEAGPCPKKAKTEDDVAILGAAPPETTTADGESDGAETKKDGAETKQEDDEQQTLREFEAKQQQQAAQLQQQLHQIHQQQLAQLQQHHAQQLAQLQPLEQQLAQQQQLVAQQLLALPPQQQRVVLQHFPPAQQQVLVHLMTQLQQLQPQYFFVNGVGHVMFTPPAQPNAEPPQPVVRQMTPAEQQHFVQLEAQRAQQQQAQQQQAQQQQQLGKDQEVPPSQVVSAAPPPPPETENDSSTAVPLLAAEDDARLENAAQPKAFAARDGVSNNWQDARALSVRVDSSAKGRGSLTAAARALDQLLTSSSSSSSEEEEAAADAGTFARRFAAAALEAIQACSKKSEIVLGWTATASKTLHEKETIGVPELAEAHGRAPDLVARLERDFLRPLLTKLWALHAAAAKDYFGSDDESLGSSASTSLGYLSPDVGWNTLVLHVADDDGDPCSRHADACDAVSPMLVLNVGDDAENNGGRVCLFEEKDARPIALPVDAAPAVCVFADFAKRGRGQLPFSKASSRRRVTVLPCRTNAAVRWSRFVATESPTQWTIVDENWVCAASHDSPVVAPDDAAADDEQ